MKITRCFLLLAILLPGFFAETASGHTFAPALFEWQQMDDHIAVRFKQPNLRARGSRLELTFPPSCQAVAPPVEHTVGTGFITSWRLNCSRLAGELITVDGIGRSQADVLLRLEMADGLSIRQVLTADRPSYRIPERQDTLAVASSYVRLGAEHIRSGIDHLLFVLGLVLLVAGWRALLMTVTAFTVGHSVTLALATLGLVTVPSFLAELAIAGSIVLLALELVRNREGEEKVGWIKRRPSIMAASFGLLHGLGFAGALTEVGLPSNEIPAALFAFNVGIELGQLAFVALVLVVGWMLRPLPDRWRVPLHGLPAYVIGSLGAFWCIERTFIGALIWLAV